MRDALSHARDRSRWSLPGHISIGNRWPRAFAEPQWPKNSGRIPPQTVAPRRPARRCCSPREKVIAPVRTLESDRPDSAWSYGPGYNSHQIRTFLRSRDVHADELETEELHAQVATLLSEKKRVGWFQGRLDLGASPVTSRSVLTTEQASGEHFIQASGRRGLDDLSRMLEERMGRPALYASPLAKPGEPLACTPSDAYDCFAPLSLDAIAMGPYLVTREMARDHSESPLPVQTARSSQRKTAEEFAGFFIWLRMLPALFTRQTQARDANAARAAKAWLAARRVLHRAHGS